MLPSDKRWYNWANPRCPTCCACRPLPRTAADFWAMVLEQQVPVVVMLTNCIEAGVTKCGQYFPDQPNSTLEYVSKAGSFEVTVSTVLECEHAAEPS